MGLVEPVDRWLPRNAVVENGREVVCVHKNSSASPSAYAWGSVNDISVNASVVMADVLHVNRLVIELWIAEIINVHHSVTEVTVILVPSLWMWSVFVVLQWSLCHAVEKKSPSLQSVLNSADIHLIVIIFSVSHIVATLGLVLHAVSVVIWCMLVGILVLLVVMTTNQIHLKFQSLQWMGGVLPQIQNWNLLSLSLCLVRLVSFLLIWAVLVSMRSTHFLVMKPSHSRVLALAAVSCPVGTTLVSLNVMLSVMQRTTRRLVQNAKFARILAPSLALMVVLINALYHATKVTVQVVNGWSSFSATANWWLSMLIAVSLGQQMNKGAMNWCPVKISVRRS